MALVQYFSGEASQEIVDGLEMWTRRFTIYWRRLSPNDQFVIYSWWKVLSAQAQDLGYPHALFEVDENGQMIQLSVEFFRRHENDLLTCLEQERQRPSVSNSLQVSWPQGPYADGVRIACKKMDCIHVWVNVETKTGLQKILALIDSGATFNIISIKLAERLDLEAARIDVESLTITIADGTATKSPGANNVSMICADHRGNYRACTQTIWRLHDRLGESMILGIPWLAEMNPILDFRCGSFIWPPPENMFPQLPMPLEQHCGNDRLIIKKRANHEEPRRSGRIKEKEEGKGKGKGNEKRKRSISQTPMDIDTPGKIENPAKKHRR